MNSLNQFLFGVYPYIALTVFFLGSLVRFEREQYSWKCDSSQLLYSGWLNVANNLFHIGIIGLFFGHAVGLLMPVVVWDVLGLSHSAKQMIAMIAGGVMGLMCLVGLVMLGFRRLTHPRLRATTRFGDRLLLGWLLITLLLGLATIFVSMQHLDGQEMVLLMSWAQHIVTFRTAAAGFMVQTSWLFKAHVFMGMSLFVLFPFTRLVHAWSGFASIFYLGRAWQLVRSRR